MSNTKQLDDVSRTNEGESIQYKTIRLMLAAKGEPQCKSQIKRLAVQYGGSVIMTLRCDTVCMMIELAIAEEREACKAVCVKAEGTDISGASEDFKDGYETGAEVCIINITARGQTY